MNHPTPAPLVAILEAIQEQTAKLSEAAAQLDVTRHFTLDGRLVGDIGEMLAAQFLVLTLDETQRRGHDGFTLIDGRTRDVQIKCRKASSLVGFSSVPDLLVIIAFSENWSSWEIIYNGEGTPIRDRATTEGFTVDAQDRIQRGGRRASLDLGLNWFRELQASPASAISVPLRSQPLAIFPDAEASRA